MLLRVLKSMLPAALLLLLLPSCRVYPPSFRSLENLKYEKLGNDGLRVGVEAVFHNPNCFRFKVKDVQCDVLLDKRKLGSLGERGEVTIKPKSNFKVPLSFTLKPDGNLLDNIKDLWNVFNGKKAELFFEGNVQLKAYGFKYNIPVREKQTLDWKLLK